MSKTPALRNTDAAIARFLLVTCVVHANRKAIVVTLAKQNPIVIACGINVFLESLKKKIAWTIPKLRYTTNKTDTAGISISSTLKKGVTNLYPPLVSHRLDMNL
jgi:hypothetical protein